MKSPYPEEFNRQAIGLTASLHFAPTQKAADALLKEGKDPEQIFVTGNTGIDALHYTVRNDFYHPETEWAKGSRLIAVTAHRRENLGEPMRDMFRAIRRIVEEFTDVKVIYPVHLNPQVRKIADEEFGGCDRIHLIEPLDVVEFHNLMKASYLIMTDSGGIQEEAPALGKPVLVMRDTTERPEGVEAGTLKLAGTKMEDIYRECRQLLTEPEIYRRMSEARNPYGDGTASIKIRKIADEEFGGCESIHLIEPLDVVEFHNLMKASYLIMTDSGGIQEEAPALGKPVLVMRDTTERPEGVEAGTLKLAGTKMDDIYRECRKLLTEPEIYRRMSEARNKELPHD